MWFTQERYVAVMTEKAELLEQVEQRELTIGQLSGETETIGWNSLSPAVLLLCDHYVQESTSCCIRPRERL